MKYKIIALDVDGTLVSSEGRITETVRTALITVQRDYGMRVVIASGRPAAGLKTIVDELELARYSGYIMPYNGGEVYNARALATPIESHTLPKGAAAEIYALAKEYGLSVVTYSTTHLLTEDTQNEFVQKEVGITGMPIEQLEDFVRDAPLNLPKCLIVGDAKTIEQVEPIARERFGGRMDAFRSNPYFLEIVPTGINKGQAIAGLLQRLDYAANELIAVGDNYNDLEMIQYAGLGVAMANAPEPIKSCADYVTTSNDADGVAHLINKHILQAHEDAPYSVEEVNALIPGTLMESLGMRCTAIAKGFVAGIMPVDSRTGQPLGIIHGGANLAFAETLAGLGSVALLDDGEMQAGAQVSGNHISSAAFGDTMRGEARIMHKGRSTHVWSVEIYSERSGKLIHTARVLNSILKKR